MRHLLVPHLALWVLGAGLIRVAVVPPETCPPVMAEQVRAAAVAGGEWLRRGLQPDGRYTYGYHRDRDEVPDDYNDVRHAAAVLSLYLLVEAGYEQFAKGADAGLAYMLDNLVSHDDWVAFGGPGRSISLGANGLLVAALAARRDATGDPGLDDLMKGVGRFLVSQQQPNGSMLAFWDPRTGAPVPERFGIFATGEAFWGLARLHWNFPAEGWDGPALAVARYLAEDRDRLEGQVTRYPDHWAAYGMAELGPELLDDDLIAYARALAGFFSVRLRVESQRTGEGLNWAVRGWPGPPSGVATSGEGMAALWRLAGRDPRLADMRPGMVDDLTCMAGMAVARQVSGPEAERYPRPGLARGAWFYRDYSQIDDQQHMIAALLGALPALEGSA